MTPRMAREQELEQKYLNKYCMYTDPAGTLWTGIVSIISYWNNEVIVIMGDDRHVLDNQTIEEDLKVLSNGNNSRPIR